MSDIFYREDSPMENECVASSIGISLSPNSVPFHEYYPWSALIFQTLWLRFLRPVNHSIDTFLPYIILCFFFVFFSNFSLTLTAASAAVAAAAVVVNFRGGAIQKYQVEWSRKYNDNKNYWWKEATFLLILFYFVLFSIVIVQACYWRQ